LAACAEALFYCARMGWGRELFERHRHHGDLKSTFSQGIRIKPENLHAARLRLLIRHAFAP
ncbi:MAG: hypothetical protein WCD83_13000, partial [Pseudolabrys sp.]